jgi:hypothetical protein
LSSYNTIQVSYDGYRVEPSLKSNSPCSLRRPPNPRACSRITGGSEFGAVPAATDRPRPFAPYHAWSSGISLSRYFEPVKVPGNPMKSPFCYGVFGGQTLAITICASRQPNHVKRLLSGLNNLLKGTFHLIVSSPGDPRGVR